MTLSPRGNGSDEGMMGSEVGFSSESTDTDVDAESVVAPASPDSLKSDATPLVHSESCYSDSGMSMPQSQTNEMELSQEAGVGFGGSWHPGQNCGRWVSIHYAVLLAACQVIIANLYLNLQQVPSRLSKALLNHLAPRAKIVRNCADCLAAQLLGVSRDFARNVWRDIASNGWQPAEPPADIATQVSTTTPLVSMKSRVREALAVCYYGRPDTEHAAAMRRIALHGVDIGVHNLSAKCVARVEVLGATAARVIVADRLQALSPSLGIPSDIALVWDGVSIGATHFPPRNLLPDWCIAPPVAQAPRGGRA